MRGVTGGGRRFLSAPGVRAGVVVASLLLVGLLVRLPSLNGPLVAISSFRQTETTPAEATVGSALRRRRVGHCSSRARAEASSCSPRRLRSSRDAAVRVSPARPDAAAPLP
ncbi:MAG: hypothetical protein WB808_10140 [Candidatus Dormiibacterota bacterium]